MNDNNSLDNKPQVGKSVGDAWLITKSKKSGRVYYFNTLTGEAVWNLSYGDLQKAKEYRENNGQPLPEPPTDQIIRAANNDQDIKVANNDKGKIVRKVNNTVPYTDSCGATMPAACPPSVGPSHNNFFYNQQPNMAYPPSAAYHPPNTMFPPQHMLYPQSNPMFASYNPTYPLSNPFYTPNYPSYHSGMMNSSVPMDERCLFVVHNTSKPLSRRFLSQKEENLKKEETVKSISQNDLGVIKKFSTSKQFDLRQVLLAKGKSRSESTLNTNQSHDNQVEDKEEDIINTQMETLNVNLNPEPAKTDFVNPWAAAETSVINREEKLSTEFVNPWAAPETLVINREQKLSTEFVNPWAAPEASVNREEELSAVPVEQCAIEEVMDSSHILKNDDNSEDEDDEKWLSENMNSFGNKAILDVSALKSLSGASFTESWYILPDTNIFYRNLTFLNILINSDDQCRLLLVTRVYNEIRAIAKKENSAPFTVAARYACRFVDQLLSSGGAVMSDDLLSHMKGVSYPVGDDEILDDCIRLVEQKHCMILLSNDRLLLRKTKIASLHTFTVKQLKNFLAYYQRRANIDNGNKPILITLKHGSSNIVNQVEENVEYEKNDVDEHELSNADYDAPLDNSDSSDAYDYPVNETKRTEVPVNRPIKNPITYNRPSKSAVTFDNPSKKAITFNIPGKNAVTYDIPSKNAVTFDRPGKSAITSEIPNKNPVTFDRLSKSSVTFNIRGKNVITFDRPGKNPVTFDRPGRNAITFDRLGENAVTFDRLGENALTFDRLAKSSVSFDKSDKNFNTFEGPGKCAITFEGPGNSAVTFNKSGKTDISSDKLTKKAISYKISDKSNITNDKPIKNTIIYDIGTKKHISNDKCGKTAISYETYKKNIANNTSSKIEITKDGIQTAKTNVRSLQLNKDVAIDTSILSKTDQTIDQHKIKKRQIRLKRNLQDNQIPNDTPKTPDVKKPHKWRRRKLTESMNKNCDNSFQTGNTTPAKQPSVVLNDSGITVVKTSSETSNPDVRNQHFAKHVNVLVTRKPQEVIQNELSDSEDSVLKKPNNSLNQTIVDDSSLSGSDVISNTRSSILSDKDVLKRNSDVNYKSDEISDSDLFKVTDPNMEENLRVGIEEWVSRFLQIMEEVLTQVLQNHKELLDANMRGPWTVYEATECIKKCFNKYFLVSNAAGSLSETISKFSDNKGKIRNLAPDQYMQMLGYGLYLVNSLKKEVENSEDIQASLQLLSSLLNDIKYPISLNNTDSYTADNNNDGTKDEEQHEDSRKFPTKRRSSEETSPIKFKRSTVPDSKKTIEEPKVKFIRNVNVSADFLKALKLQKSPANKKTQVSKSSVVEKTTFLDNAIETSDSQKTDKRSHQPKRIITFNNLNPEYEQRLLNKEKLALNSENALEVKNNNVIDYEQLDYDEEIEREDQIDYEDEMDYDNDVDYQESGFKENNYYDNENNLNVTSKKTNDDVGVLVKRFLVIIKETFAEVKVFCDQTLSDFGYAESIHLSQKLELQKLIEHKQTVINDLLKTLRSIFDRETTAPTKIYIKSALAKSNLLNCDANGELSSYGDIVGKCASQADVLLDALSYMGQIVNQKIIVD